MREGVGLVVADVRDGGARIDRQQALERHLVPGAVALLPIPGGLPVVRLYRRPAVGEPNERLAIAAGFHEGEPFAVGHAAIGQTEGIEQHLVPRPLVVVREAGAVVADGANAAFETDVLGGGDRLNRLELGNGIAIGRPQRLGSEQAENVGKQQLLMLLLVIDAELDQDRQRIGPLIDEAAREELRQRLIDVGAIRAHLLRRRARQQPAPPARLSLAFALVVGVEAVLEVGRELAVVRQVRLEDETLVEPGRVREVPFRRTGVVHRLHGLVFVAQRSCKRERELAARSQALVQIGDANSGFGAGGGMDRKR